MIAFVAANLLKNFIKWPVGNGFMVDLLIQLKWAAFQKRLTLNHINKLGCS
jgi:hypothetical protein